MKLAIVFPGQGSQAVGMMAGYAEHPLVRATFVEASQVLAQDLWSLVEDGPAEVLNQTVNTQPVMLTADVAVYRAWRAAGGAEASVMAGHSLGEYAALVAAASIAFADALPLVRFRAQAMQDAVPQGVGAMAAIMGLDDDGVVAACAEAAQMQSVEAVNFNAPGQVVIAGHKEAVERAIVAAKARGAKRGLLLPVSAPFHSKLLQPAAEKLAAYLAEVPVRIANVGVLHNVDAARAATPEAIRAALARQAASPVRWVETIQAFVAQGVTHVIECGPGTVLTGLARRIAPGVEILPLNDAGAIAAAIAATAA
ncbi:MAG TPA: ACP S-malonyltransferase [Casimicrobiaceae bacterium]|nr:ACP S-malonyltransferase [Casimicrobiaceae bacterium]